MNRNPVGLPDGFYRRNDSPYIWFAFYHAGKKIQFSCKSDQITEAKAEAKRKQREIESEADAGVVATGKVSALFNLYIADLEDNERTRGEYATAAENSRTSYKVKSSITKHLVPVFGNVKSNEIDNAMLDAYVDARMKEPRNGKPLTAKQRTARRLGINRELGYLRRSLRLGMRRGLVNPNVIARLQFPIDAKVEKLSVRTGVIDPETYDKIYVASAPHFRPILTTVLYTGIRSKEIKWVRREQVDFKERVIHLRTGETKEGDPRTVPMSDQVWAELKKWDDITKQEWPKAEFFFHYEGRQNNDFKKAWQRAIKRAGVKGVRFHDSRRTVVTSLMEDGQSESDIRKVTGHKSKVFTQYDQSRKGAMDRIRSAQNRLQGNGDTKTATGTDDVMERLERLGAMLKGGLLTAKEFSLLKSKLIA